MEQRAPDVAFIEGYDFGFIVDRMVKDGMERAAAEASAADLKTLMLGVARHPDVTFAAWGRVDDALHAFILDTRAFREFCAKAFGRMVDHIPTDAGGPIPFDQACPFDQAWENTVTFLVRDLGVAPRPGVAGPASAEAPAACMITLEPAACMITLEKAACMVTLAPGAVAEAA